jgi:hypothetical protein
MKGRSGARGDVCSVAASSMLAGFAAVNDGASDDMMFFTAFAAASAGARWLRAAAPAE